MIRAKISHFFIFLLASFVACVPTFGQGSTGSINGGVTDQAGGSVAGSSVVITDVARGVSRTLTTDESG